MRNPSLWLLWACCALAMVQPVVLKDKGITQDALALKKTSAALTKPDRSPAQKQTSKVPASALAEMQKGIATMEYDIHYQAKAGCLQSPNRKQNLRFSYTDNGFSAQARVDSTGRESWKYSLKVKGIYKGRTLLAATTAKPAAKVTENKLTYDYGSYQAEYVNNEDGMRQNFIVKNKPQGDGLLKVALEVKGDLKPELVAPTELVLAKSAGSSALSAKVRYKDLKVWDAAHKALAAHMELQGNELALVVEDKDATYPVTIDPLSTTASTTLESNQADAELGYSIASAGDVNGDGYSDVIVGAPYYDDGQTDEGVAFVYYGSGSGLSSTAGDTLEINQASAYMGWSVATAGDVNGDGYSDVIVGAYKYDDGQTDEGAAFVYHGSSTGLPSSASTTLEANQASAYMGYSVATAGDVNGDGYSDVIVGAYKYDDGNTDEGAAFVYEGSSSGLSTTASTTLESNQTSAYMGCAVAPAGDVNGDGYSDIIVGANYYDNGQTDEGAAFVYHGSSSGLSTTASATLESNQASAYAGTSVASAGDVNADGYSDVIVGAPNYDDGNTDEGAAFVYHGSSSGVSTTISNTLESNQTSAYMGSSVACAGDIDGNGYSDIIIGANYYDDGSTDEGAVFVFKSTASGLSALDTLESNQASAYMGTSVASAGDVNGDGYSDITTGAYYYDNGQTNEGAAFVYQGAPDGIDTTTTTSIYGGQSFAHMGYSVAGAGDVNGDGYSDIIIGADQYDDGQTDEGAAFVYLGSSSGINTTANAQLESNQASAYFGWSVATAGDVNGDGYSDVLVGTYRYNNGVSYEGAAFLYYGSSSGITGSATILSSHQTSAYFGQSVASAGDVNGDGYSDIIVGAYAYDDGNTNEGAAFIYHGSSSGIDTTVKAKLESNQANAYMGYSVASAGDVNGDGYGDVVVGAYAYDDGQTNEGAAFVYLGSSNGVDTTIQAQVESDQASANMGYSVSSAGDVNGDGYSDIIVGAKQYKNTQTGEGSAYVYYGSSSGISTTIQQQYYGTQYTAYLGGAVACAGDVNGDGYSDVIIGAMQYDDPNLNEGAAFVYTGSSSGLSSTPFMQIEGNMQASFMGFSVAGAGDINGDGYSDVIAGGYQYKSSITAEGGAKIVLGSNGKGLRNNLRLYDKGTTDPLSHSNFTNSKVTGGLYAKSFLGKQKGKMAWETKGEGVAFSSANSLLANSVTTTSSQSSYSSLGLTGTELTADITKVGTFYTRLRARVKYDPATAITGQVYGPWRYPINAPGLNIAPLPVELVSFTASWKESCADASLSWTTASETNSSHFEIERSWDGRTWEQTGTVASVGNSQSRNTYHFEDHLSNMPAATVYYRLKQVDYNGKYQYLPVRSLYCRKWDNAVSNIYPIPAQDELHIVLKQPLAHAIVSLINAAGVTVLQQPLLDTDQVLDVQSLKPGTYYLYISVDGIAYHTQTITIVH